MKPTSMRLMQLALVLLLSQSVLFIWACRQKDDRRAQGQNQSNLQSNKELRSEPEAQKGGKSNIPDEYRVTITGRLLDKNNSPIAGISVMLMEASVTNTKEGEQISTTLKTGADGKLANPETSTDSEGRFTIVADRRFWEETGKFTLHGGFLPGTTVNAGNLQGPNGSPLLITVDSNTNKLDLGDIIVKTKLPASAQTQQWHVRLDSFQFAEVKEAEQRVILGATPTNSIGIAITFTAMEEISFPEDNYARTLVKGVPTLTENRFGALAWSGFSVTYELGRLDEAGLQMINAFQAADEKIRGIYLMSSKKGRVIEKGKRVTLILVAKLPDGFVPVQGKNEFMFRFPGFQSVRMTFASTRLNLELAREQ